MAAPGSGRISGLPRLLSPTHPSKALMLQPRGGDSGAPCRRPVARNRPSSSTVHEGGATTWQRLAAAGWAVHGERGLPRPAQRGRSAARSPPFAIFCACANARELTPARSRTGTGTGTGTGAGTPRLRAGRPRESPRRQGAEAHLYVTCVGELGDPVHSDDEGHFCWCAAPLSKLPSLPSCPLPAA